MASGRLDSNWRVHEAFAPNRQFHNGLYSQFTGSIHRIHGTISRDDVIDLPISVEEAIGFAISGGVLRPPSQQVPALQENKDDPWSSYETDRRDEPE